MQTNWNLNDLYTSNDEFNADYSKVNNMLDELCKFKNKLKKNDKKILKKYFEIDEKFSKILEKIAVYAHCKHDDNAKDDISQKNYALINDFFAKSSELCSFVKPELCQLDEKFLLDLKKDEDFSNYSRTIEYLIRTKKHTLTSEQEGVLSVVSGFSSSDDIYSVLSDIEMNHGKVIGEDGKEIQLTTGNYNLLLKSDSQEFRKKVMEAYLKEYGRFNMTISGLYISHVKHMNFNAKLRKFSSTLDMETYLEEVDSSIMLKNIEFVGKKVSLIQDFFNLKKDILKLKTFYSSDITANISSKSKTYSFDESITQIRSSFAPLGKDYQEMFDKALAEGWIDVYPRENKASGGYTISTYSCHPYILLNYDGTSYWRSAVAHEFGHAMHSYYSAKAQPYPKADYTIFVAEVASLTNEILLAHYLLKTETDVKQKMQIICDFLGTFYLNVFNSSMLAEFELYVHENLWQGKTITPDNLNKKFVNLCEKYFNDSVTLVSGYEYDWERKSHIFRDYYLYKYSTGFICASAVASKILGDKTGEYKNKYKKFLSLGGSLSPIESLKVAEIDITNEETYNFAFSNFETFLNELKSIYKENL